MVVPTLWYQTNSLGSSDYTDTDVNNGTTYYYVVTAFDTSDNESGFSIENFATPVEGGGIAESVYVSNIVANQVSVGKEANQGQAQVTILDNLGHEVEGDIVNGTFFNNKIGGSDRDIINSSGLAILITSKTAKGSLDIAFCVESVVSSLSYDFDANVETCDIK